MLKLIAMRWVAIVIVAACGSCALGQVHWESDCLGRSIPGQRSEEHTSELQSRFDLVDFLSFPTRRSSDLICLKGFFSRGGRKCARVAAREMCTGECDA